MIRHPQTQPPVLNAFTVDVEDYFHVQAFADRIRPNDWQHLESRVVQNTHRVLRLLDKHQVRGTFFVLGWVAHRHPLLVRDIQKAGHEIGSHGFWHRLIYQQTPEEFREDLLLSLKVVEEITGEAVRSYRAPCFSITRKSLWALEILIEEGIQYDSSIYPIYHDNYGIPNAERFPYRIERDAGTLWEFPPTVYRLWRVNVPVSGGGFFRMYPAWMSMRWWSRIHRRHQRPCMFYIHPWEVDPDQPRLSGSLKSRFRHYYNLRTTNDKLDRLLGRFSFSSMTQALDVCNGSEMPGDQLPARVDAALPRS